MRGLRDGYLVLDEGGACDSRGPHPTGRDREEEPPAPRELGRRPVREGDVLEERGVADRHGALDAVEVYRTPIGRGGGLGEVLREGAGLDQDGREAEDGDGATAGRAYDVGGGVDAGIVLLEPVRRL